MIKSTIASIVLALALISPVAASALVMPTCTLTATPATVSIGQSITLSWTTANASSTSWVSSNFFSSTALSGSATIKITSQLTQFMLTATGAHGLGIASCHVNVITAPAPLPPIPAIPPIKPIAPIVFHF